MRTMTTARILMATTLVALAIGSVATATAAAAADAYETYVNTSKDFKPVKQDKDWAWEAWPQWAYMPWTYKWGIGYTDASGKWSVERGYNGAFIDHGQTTVGGVDKLAWINKYKLWFYVDHTAGKGDLHLWDGSKVAPHYDAIHGTGVRNRPLNAAMERKLKGLIRKRVTNVKSSPYRAAYALDDELSWGHFVHPCMWQVTDDRGAYDGWLKEIYGAADAPQHSGWLSYDAVWPKLSQWAVKDFDASQLMDQWTFNDSYWNNFLGDLVEYANTIDPATPVGHVGGQSPNAFGGYDYAKQMRKLQFIEAYNLGGSQAVIRSFNPRNALPTVTTHFHKNPKDTIWQTWYYLAHGNRGFIGWVDGWFDGKTPKGWHTMVGRHYKEAGSKIGPLMRGAEWIHDGVAIYYNHASVQLGWIFDAESHRKTWRNRNNDHKLGAAHHVRHAWENMLRDEGLQYTFVNYVDVIQAGVPSEYKVLIVPAALCLSDVEAERIKAFCRAGGTVIADYLPGLWDQHGRGRTTGGVLDDMFGVKHDPNLKAGDVFGEQLWAEVNQDANFSWKTYEGMLTNASTCVKDATGFHKAVRTMPVATVTRYGKGVAVLMNLSPQWYNAYRTAGGAEVAKRDVFMRHVKAAGLARWVDLVGEDVAGCEVTYWSAPNGRTLLFVCSNPEVQGTALGGGNSVGLRSKKTTFTLKFAKPVKGARDERAGKDLGDGDTFTFTWRMNEAVVMSFDGPPPAAK